MVVWLAQLGGRGVHSGIGGFMVAPCPHSSMRGGAKRGVGQENLHQMAGGQSAGWMGGDVAGGKEMGATYSSLLNEFTTCFTIDCILYVHCLKALWSLSFGPFHDDVVSLSLSPLLGC